MSSLILSHNSHLMMLEVAVENLFVPWTSTFDKIIVKKTIVMFRMLDEEWIALSPNRRDCRPYQGSNYENEKFYGGKSVVFSVPTDFFGKKVGDVNIQLYVQKQVYKYFKMVSREKIGFVAVPVDNLLNSIAKQIRERNELAEHLSDSYKRQIISRSTMGTYILSDENFRNTAATISLYIRISYLGKCLVTEIAPVESIRGAFYTRGDSDEKQSYLSRQLTSKELQRGCSVDYLGLPRVPHDRLICRCEKLVKKETADLSEFAMIRKIFAADVDAMKKRRISADKIVDSTGAISYGKDVIKDGEFDSAAADADEDAMKKRRTYADTIVDSTGAISYGKDVIKDEEFDSADADADEDAMKKRRTYADTIVDSTGAISYGKDVIKDEEFDSADADVDAMEKRRLYADTIVDSTDAIFVGKDVIKDGEFHALADTDAATAKMKEHAIKDNGERTLLGKSKLGRSTATIGIAERGKRICPSPSIPFLQTYPLCCQLQPHLTCFTDCFDVSPYYCYWTACRLPSFLHCRNEFTNTTEPY